MEPSPEAFPGGAGDGGIRGAARPGQRWDAEDCRARPEARGSRMDQFSICWMPFNCFEESCCTKSRRIAFDIGMLGQHGLDINDPQESHVLRKLPGRTFSALQLICIMYARFKRIDPGMDIGVDLGEERGE